MPQVVYICSRELLAQCDKIPVCKQRASMVHALIQSYNLHRHMRCIKPRLATADELALFHSSSYLSYLQTECADETRNIDTDSESDESSASDVDDELLSYGLGYDCPKFRNLWKFATTIAGGTLTAAELLLSGQRIVINWCGGWHHAQRDEAEGFCYVNDIGIGLQRLRSRFRRILYIDLDVHHGDGVEEAFAHTRRVFTLSFHQYEVGFYPGSGAQAECGLGAGKGYCANFPYRSHIHGERFVEYFKKTARAVVDQYKPEVCVVQCGADSIVGDPLGGTNLIPEDIGSCIELILSWQRPTIFLGGGGYNFPNASRYWTYLTALICNRSEHLNTDIPDNDQFFLRYGPSYELTIARKTLDDQNTTSELDGKLQTIKDNLKRYNVFDC